MEDEVDLLRDEREARVFVNEENSALSTTGKWPPLEDQYFAVLQVTGLT